jgi:hypothetical protein
VGCVLASWQGGRADTTAVQHAYTISSLRMCLMSDPNRYDHATRFLDLKASR